MSADQPIKDQPTWKNNAAGIVAVLALKIECGCGDIRPLSEFCPKCGRCAIGCCMCEPPALPETQEAL